MNIKDLIHETEEEELAAISQFFRGRADDINAPGSLSMDAFTNLANKLGLNIDSKRLAAMVQAGEVAPISDVNDDEVKFDSEEGIGPEQMSRDRAEMTLKQAAKRAANKRSK